MINRYFKVPPQMAKALGINALPKRRLPDGNYMAMSTDFEQAEVCKSYELLEKAPKLGCAVLTPLQRRYEEEGLICTPLPQPTEEYRREYWTSDDAAPSAEPHEEEPAEEPTVEPEQDQEEGGAE